MPTDVPNPGRNPSPSASPSPRSSRRLRLSAQDTRPRPGDAGYDPLVDDIGEPPVTVDSSNASVLAGEPDSHPAAARAAADHPTSATVPVLPPTITGGKAATRTGLRPPVRLPSEPEPADSPPPPTLPDLAPSQATPRTPAPGSSGESGRSGLAGSASSGSGRHPQTLASDSNIEGLEIALALASRSKFHIGRELGRGGSAQVLAARDVSLRRDVALKYLARPEAGQARFIEEAQITAQLQHPNIVPVYELGVDRQKKAYMAMKRVHGRTLSQVIANAHRHADRHPTEWTRFLRRLLDVYLKVCDAIGYAHARKVIHRDLKPDNVMVGAFGEVLVMDWGLARPLDAEVPAADDLLVPGQKPPPNVKSDRRTRHYLMTLDGQILGTLPYMPPEQAEGRHSELDTRADIYALGAILYQVLTNHPPYAGTDVDVLREQVQAGRLQPPSSKAPAERVPRELEAVVLRAMAFDPADRYPTVGALRDDIERYLDGRALDSVAYGRIELLAKWVQRNRVLAGGIAATVLALVAGVIGVVLVDSEARARDAKTQAEKLAASQRAQAAELDSARAEAAREAAERKSLTEAQGRREAELRTLVQQGEIDKLREALGIGARNEASELVREFKTLYDAARIAGKDREFVEHLGQERIDQFVAAFDRLLQSGVNVTANDRLMASMLYLLAMDDAGRALAQCNLALQDEPGHPRALFMRAMAKATMADHAGAIDDYSAAIRGEPANLDALFNRAKSKMRLGDTAGAIEDYTSVIRINPRHSGAYVNRGAALATAGNPARAEEDFNRAVQLDETSAHAWYNRGKMRALRGDVRGANDDYEHALAINPDLHDCRVDRAVAWTLSKPMEALADLEYVLQQDPHHWRANYQFGLLMVMRGKRDDARAAFATALEHAPPESKPLVQDTRRRMLGE